MPIVVQKYGGSSVADVEKIRRVAGRVKATRDQGYQVVVVVSAMGDTTDELLALAKKVSADPPRRELDMLLTSGERISNALLAMAINAQGGRARSFTGSQAGMITTGKHGATHAPVFSSSGTKVAWLQQDEDGNEADKCVLRRSYLRISTHRLRTTAEPRSCCTTLRITSGQQFS